jgi:hypothetical protein
VITISNLGRPKQLPRRRTGHARIASIDVEWTKNYRIKNGNRPFCYSVVTIDVPGAGKSVDLETLPFAYTSVYVEEPAETTALVASAAEAVQQVLAEADLVVGHQLCSDLAVLNANADYRPAAVETAREIWKRRRSPREHDTRFLDTRYDADHLLGGTSRRLVDVCTELALDVRQPELRGTSMTALHRKWLETADPVPREKISVLNLRHSLSTAYVALRAAGLGSWSSSGLNVNSTLAAHARSAWGWLESPTFNDLLGDSCPSGTAQLSR